MFRFFERRIVAVESDRRDYREEHGHRDAQAYPCLLYTSDAADDHNSV